MVDSGNVEESYLNIDLILEHTGSGVLVAACSEADSWQIGRQRCTEGPRQTSWLWCGWWKMGKKIRTDEEIVKCI